MVYVDPYKLQSRELSLMDVVHTLNSSNLILPAGDVKIGPYDFYVYSNSLVDKVKDLNDIPLKAVGDSWVRVSDVGERRRIRGCHRSTTSCEWRAEAPLAFPS